ncbi:hypothetical protein [Bradyrhizobium sp. STM 3562]|uniref:hypothetical protein n=1 Tax=Bradyrhizobium sp. STM 3562 TaxID=578924 RepID=UPI0038904F1F
MADFRVIEGGGPEGRSRLLAEQELRNALHITAANLLRIVRGAGKPYELMMQFNRVVQAAIQYRDAVGHWPPSDLLGQMLRMRDEVDEMHEREAAGKCTEADMERWYEDGTIDRKYAEASIKAGVLQIIASQFVDQPLQEKAGKSEMSDGKLIAAKAKSHAYWNAELSRAKNAPKKQMRADRPAAPKPESPAAMAETSKTPPIQLERTRQQTAAFGQEDLRELRKAIKAKDSKKIAELTSKIGKRPLRD